MLATSIALHNREKKTGNGKDGRNINFNDKLRTYTLLAILTS